jgi:hypothetical protein
MGEQVDSSKDKLFYGIHVGTEAWMSIWKAHPEWQREMLTYASGMTDADSKACKQMELELKGEGQKPLNDYAVEVPDGMHIKYRIELDVIAFDKMLEITPADLVEVLVEVLEEGGDIEIKKLSCKETFKKQVYTSLDPF